METTEVKEIRLKKGRHSSVGNRLGHLDMTFPYRYHSQQQQRSLLVSTYTKGMLKGTSLCVFHCLVENRNSEEFSIKISAFQPQSYKRYYKTFIDICF
jgi:hypothetical protein